MQYPFKHPFELANDGTGNGASVLAWVRGTIGLTLQVGGTFNATVAVQGRLDPSLEWEPIGMEFTAHGIAQITGTYDQLRIVVTDYVSGIVVVYLAGQTVQQA